jgi:hypothetical protein
MVFTNRTLYPDCLPEVIIVVSMYARILRNLKMVSSSPDIWIASIAGLVYSSWPLGFILNPFVARHDFASQLEAAHQPYNWVFISLDIVSGLLLLIVGLRQWRAAGSHWSLRLSILAYALFGIFVILAAVAPDNCTAGTYCQALVRTPAFLVHGFSSIVSVVFLFSSLLLPAKILIRGRFYRRLLLLAVFITAGWGLTGIGALLELAHGLRSNWLQYGLITLCSLSLVFCTLLVQGLSRHQAPAAFDADTAS